MGGVPGAVGGGGACVRLWIRRRCGGECRGWGCEDGVVERASVVCTRLKVVAVEYR